MMKRSVIAWTFFLVASCRSGASDPTPPSPDPSSRVSYERLVRTALSYLEANRLSDAETLLERAKHEEPERSEAYGVMGRLLALQNHLPEGAAQYEMARGKKSRDRRLFVELTSIYDVLGRYEDALEVYRDWLAGAPDDVEMLHEYGLTLLLQKEYREAQKILFNVCDLAPDNRQAQEDLGFAYFAAGDEEAASRTFDAVLAKERKRPNTLRMLAQVRLKQGQVDEALSLLDEAYGYDPNDAQIQRMRSRLRQILEEAP